METIYIVNVRMTGVNGNVIHFVESAFTHINAAFKMVERMTEAYEYDPNFLAYVTGPILLNEHYE